MERDAAPGAVAGPELDLIHDAARAAALLDPLRLRMLDELRQPDSATGLGRRLGMPRQVVNYHLRELERNGLLEVVERRRKRGCVERVLRTRARSYLISPEVLGSLAADPARVADRFSSAYLAALAARMLREVAELRERAEAAGKPLATLSLETEIRFASAAGRHAFAEELANAIAQLTAKYHDPTAPGGRRFRVLAACHPVPQKAGATTSQGAEHERQGKKGRRIH